MKLERLNEYITVTVVTLLGMGFAIYAGKLSGSFQFQQLAMILAGLGALLLLLVMRTNIWLIIPISWPLWGRVGILPLPFQLNELMILVAFVAFLAFKALKVSRRKPEQGFLELVMWINLIYLVTVFLRNPVGTDVLGSSKVGGKPYVAAIIGLMAYWVLARVAVAPGLAKRLPLMLTLGAMTEGFVGMVTYRFPSLVVPVSQVYNGGISTETYNQLDSTYEQGAMNRVGFTNNFGSPLVRLLCSWFPPLTLVNPLYFWRFCAFAFSCYGVMNSGYRSSVLAAMGFFALATYFRRRINDFFNLAIFAVPLVLLLIILQGHFVHLPLEIQRSISFLPAKWDQAAVEDAQGTTEWRVNIWKAVLTTDKYISNKALGDGFGYTRAQYERMLVVWTGGLEAENAMLNGDFHSGPVSTIRFVGGVGLVLFYVLLFVLARDAWRLVRKAEGTPYFSLALIVCCPIIYEPFGFTFVFGAFQGNLPTALFSVGMLRMLRNSLEAYQAEAATPLPERPARVMPRRAPVRPPAPVHFVARAPRG